MRTTVLSILFLLFSTAAFAQSPPGAPCTAANVNTPYNDNVNNVPYLCVQNGSAYFWKAGIGIGAPTVGCSSVNYGAIYTDVSSGTGYTCGIEGWKNVAVLNAPPQGVFLAMPYCIGCAAGAGFPMVSTDGTNWEMVDPNGTFFPDYVHDAAPFEANGVIYWAYTHEPSGTSTSFRVESTGDLRSWDLVADVSFAAVSPTHVWSPKWFTDSDGTVHIYAACLPLGICETHAMNSTLTSWSAAQVVYNYNSSSEIDPFVMKVGSTYYLWYVDTSSNETIQYATGTSATGPFTVQTSGNWAGFGTDSAHRQEGPSIVQLNNGCYRLYFDYTQTAMPNNLVYADACNGFTGATPFSAPTAITWPNWSNAPVVAPQLHQGQFTRTLTSATLRDIVLANQSTLKTITGNSLQINQHVTYSSSSPTIGTGWGAGAAIGQDNGTAAWIFYTGATATSGGTFGMPGVAKNGWMCQCRNITTLNSATACLQSNDSATSITFGNYSSSGVLTNFTAGDTLAITCTGH